MLIGFPAVRKDPAEASIRVAAPALPAPVPVPAPAPVPAPPGEPGVPVRIPASPAPADRQRARAAGRGSVDIEEPRRRTGPPTLSEPRGMNPPGPGQRHLRSGGTIMPTFVVASAAAIRSVPRRHRMSPMIRPSSRRTAGVPVLLVACAAALFRYAGCGACPFNVGRCSPRAGSGSRVSFSGA
jgi:hypothetical protein